MNVVIDIGNTLTKVASFDEDQLIDVYRLNDDEILSCIQKINPQSGGSMCQLVNSSIKQ